MSRRNGELYADRYRDKVSSQDNAMVTDLLARFDAEHRELEQVMAQLREALADDAPDRLHALKWRFCFLIARHVSVEDTHAYPALQSDPRPHVAQTLARFTGKIGALRERIEIWQAAWPADRVACERELFATETLTLLDEVDHRIASEERDLFPLLALTDFLKDARKS